MTHAFGLSPHLPEMASPAPSIVFARPADIMRANSAAPVGSTKPNGVRPGLSTITMDSLQRKDFPPREMVLTPLLPAQGLMMIYGPRGKGKTWLSLSIAHAIASGGEVFEGWHAPKPRRILVVDGEMQGVAIRDRLAAIAKGANAQPPDPENFQILAMDMQGRDAVAPNIAIREGQLALAPFIEHADVVIFDNL
ncbi:MAG TPA: AAA family ATPase, partial [Micropepsaceae bacterium]|nr:AAA family ATPase [Micropepsaceae bacterium]